MSTIATSDTCTASWHGTYPAARAHGCRCPEARAAARAQWRRRIPTRPRPCPTRAIRGKSTGFDPVAVERAVAGDRTVPLTVPERAAAIDQLDDLGYSADQIARRLGISIRGVHRQRANRRNQQHQDA